MRNKLMKKREAIQPAPSYFRRNNLYLVGCSPAEPISVLIEQSKLLYLQSVKKSDHFHLVQKFNEIIFKRFHNSKF